MSLRPFRAGFVVKQAGMSRNSRNASIFDRLRAASRVFRASWTPQGIDELDRWMDTTLGGSGDQALTFTAYFSGVMQISQSIGSVPFQLFKREGEMKRRPWIEHPVYNILNNMANPWANSLKWRETAEEQCINYGNSYSYIVRDTSSRPKEVYLLDTTRMKVEVKDSGEPVYLYTRKNGKQKRYTPDEIFNLIGFGPDMYTGYSMIELHRKAIKLGLNQQDFSNAFIDNGVATSGVATHPGQIKQEAYERLRDDLEKRNAGARNAGKILIFEEGMTFQTMTMPLKDAEFLGSKVFQIQEIARILNIPPHKLKDLSRATFSNIEHQQIEFVTDTMRPWAERWESAANTQLLSKIERKKGFTEHDLNALMRGDMKTLYESQRIGRFAGLTNANEGRFKLGMNPVDGDDIGQRYWQPSNMLDASSDMAAGIAPPEPIESTGETT